MDYIEIENQYTSGVYGKRQVCFVKGQRALLWDDHDKEYIDCGAGIAVANLGHAHPKIVKAIADQAATLMTAPELAYNDKRALFLQKLISILPEGINRAFLCNSGTEAVEGCIKFARLATHRPNIVATMKAFHGRTLGALSATHKSDYRDPFVPLVPGFSHVPYNNIAKMNEAITDQTAAVILELVQGEGGIRLADADYLQAVRQLCDERGALLILDEVQTGFGRTGRWLACDHYGVRPDLIALGKGIAGGFPMGAIGIGDSLGTLPTGVHGSTFGGNPLACAAGLAALTAYEEEELLARAETLGIYFREKLEEINSPLVREVRGLGLMIGVELKVRVAPIMQVMMERGVLVLNAGPTVLRFLPPLVITEAQIDHVVETLAAVLQESAASTPA